MQKQFSIPFMTLLLMISFASVNAVLFTPALPDIKQFFHLTDDQAQLTMIWFLTGYALGQLVYGPIANRFGRKPAVYCGVGLQIVSSLICVLSGWLHIYSILVAGRFFLALGSGVGLKMTFTLVNECLDARAASQKIAYLTLAFAVTPGLAVALGGVLTAYYGWESCFFALAAYGLFLLILTFNLPETLSIKDKNALKITHLFLAYVRQFRNTTLVSGGLLMGCCSAFVYIFAAVAPFVAINLMGMNSTEYGFANLLPPIGLLSGSLSSARLVRVFPLKKMIGIGIVIAASGSVIMILAVHMQLSAIFSIFFPMMFIYYGLCFILANASTIAMHQVDDKSHGSAVMSFLNMGLATLAVICLGPLTIKATLLPGLFLLVCALMMVLYQFIGVRTNQI
ncbi:Bicyclomycin resistance protein [Aquicella siphonis]|uniref:Bicyclomycin resistance protein n=1 Tax=Aquicella siphonis TaxID=254247 RepID=A0A5E4PL06_9COXI|nr:MFS transporter [Aquicella siphonis]VVC77013.1 Bicyclomycin resistance protein [Aquicella siphonis]